MLQKKKEGRLLVLVARVVCGGEVKDAWEDTRRKGAEAESQADESGVGANETPAHV